MHWADAGAPDTKGAKDIAPSFKCSYPCCEDYDCEDGNVCTVDQCWSNACVFLPSSVTCAGDECVSGKCAGTTCQLDYTPKDCDDGNPCTWDKCKPGQGCTFTPLDAVPCGDGGTGTCQQGLCCPADPCAGRDCGTLCGDDCGACPSGLWCNTKGKCATAPPPLLGGWFVVTAFNFADPVKMEGCDFSGDGKPDNAFFKLKSLFGSSVADHYTTKEALLLHDTEGDGIPPGPAIGVLEGTWSSSGELCGASSSSCSVHVPASRCVDTGQQIECKHQWLIDGASIADDVIEAGGPTSTFLGPMFPIGEQFIVVDLTQVTLHAERISAATGWRVTVCGLATLAAMTARIEAVPDAEWSAVGLPVSKDAMVGLLKTLFKPDIATRGNGVKDAVSAGFVLEVYPAAIHGIDKSK